ncbi:BTB domain containing protein [Pyrenophora tritici-repentis]|nr:BTB domain containing protein [Pyrenophora tritici-repentis]
MAEASKQQVLTTVKGLLESGAYSDFVITCGADTHKVHKAIVCTQVDFFAHALEFGGKESTLRKVDLPRDDPEVVKQMIQYLYKGEYDPVLPDTESTKTERFPMDETKSVTYHFSGNTFTYAFPHTCTSVWGTDVYVCSHHTCGSAPKTDFVCEECDPSLAYVPLNGTSDQLLLHAKMYEITDKYNVVGLKDLVVEKFSRACKNFWDDDNFPIAAHHAFSTTPEDDMDLRSIVSATIDAHIELVDKFAVIDLMLDFSELGVGVLRKKVKDHG